MPCIFFRAVTDPKKRVTAGVLGYCVGYSEEKLRIPSLEEYHKYCTSALQEGCCVFDFRAQGAMPIKRSRRKSRPEEKTAD